MGTSRAARMDAADTTRSANHARRADAIEGASPKIQKIYLEENGSEIPLDHTMRRSRKEDTSDLTWPERATDVTPTFDNRRSSASGTSRASSFDGSRTSVSGGRSSSFDGGREEYDLTSAGNVQSLRASTKRITYDSDNWDSYDPYGEDLSEEPSYHEERMARKAQRAAQEGQASRSAQSDRSSRVARSVRSGQTSRSRRGSTVEEQQAVARQRRAAATKEAERSSGRQANRRPSGKASAQRSSTLGKVFAQRSRTSGKTAVQRSRTGRKTNKKKLLPFIAAAALVVVAAVIVIIIFASKIKEAANLTLSTTDTTQTISWTRKGKDIGYEVLQKAPDGTFQVVKTVSPEGATAVTVEGLNSATLYEYKVRALKGTDKPRKSAGVTIKGYTAPSVLTDITASTQVKESLTFVWSDPQPIAGFELRYGPSEDFHDATTVTLTAENIVVDEGNGKYTYTIENQPEGTKYYYAMRSYCDQNSYSDWTPTATARVTRPVDMHGIDVNAPMVALTFDDGPDVSNITSRILDAFAGVGGHATFFQLGQRAEMYPEKIQRIVNEGHEIGNHTYDHSHMGDAVTSDDIIHANDAIEAAGGVRPVSFRSPGGNTTELIRQTCIQENMTLYYWSMDTRDWYTKDAAETVSYIKSHVEDGDIILMHNIYDSSAEAVEEIVPWLVEQGYQLVTVSQLLVAKTGNLPEPGLEYYTATKTLDR
ncbi:MAG: polysaccharide deacetylase family protein [Lachnospiraceae bacterium]|nr:polysaccharide deacetylase family protein [Lachnospiraceae bacterium]